MVAPMPGRPGSVPPPNSDWPAQAAAFVEQTVAKARSRTTVPALLIARGLVYGTLAAIIGTMVLVLVCIALVRALDRLLPGNVWQAHLVVGVLFLVLGAVAWRKRRAPLEAAS